MPWGHAGIFSGYDTASIRRGYIVYKNVCAACHSLERIHYRELVGVCMDEDTAKAAAAEIDVVDGPNDVGQMFERPGKLSDPLPSPYANGTFKSCPETPPPPPLPLSRRLVLVTPSPPLSSFLFNWSFF